MRSRFLGNVLFFPLFFPEASHEEAQSSGRSKLKEALEWWGSQPWLPIISIWGALKNITACSLPSPALLGGLEFNWSKAGEH